MDVAGAGQALAIMAGNPGHGPVYVRQFGQEGGQGFGLAVGHVPEGPARGGGVAQIAAQEALAGRLAAHQRPALGVEGLGIQIDGDVGHG